MRWRRSWTDPLISVVAAVIWLILAWRTPTSTHHFAPIVVAMMWGLSARWNSESGSLNRSITVASFVGGLALSFGAIAVLGVADKLQGPGLYGSFPVVPELILHGLVGAVIGARPWTLMPRRATA